MDDLACTGTELTLISCRHSPIGQHNCVHSEDAGVRCTPSTRGKQMVWPKLILYKVGRLLQYYVVGDLSRNDEFKLDFVDFNYPQTLHSLSGMALLSKAVVCNVISTL